MHGSNSRLERYSFAPVNTGGFACPVSASLAFFPIGGDDPTCNAGDYQKAVIPMTALPNASAFSTALNQGPDGHTPTEPALKGAIDAAKAVKATGKNVAIVLATDDGRSAGRHGPERPRSLIPQPAT